MQGLLLQVHLVLASAALSLVLAAPAVAALHVVPLANYRTGETEFTATDACTLQAELPRNVDGGDRGIIIDRAMAKVFLVGTATGATAVDSAVSIGGSAGEFLVSCDGVSWFTWAVTPFEGFHNLKSSPYRNWVGAANIMFNSSPNAGVAIAPMYHVRYIRFVVVAIGTYTLKAYMAFQQ